MWLSAAALARSGVHGRGEARLDADASRREAEAVLARVSRDRTGRID